MKEVIMQVASYSSDYPKAPIYVADLVRCDECRYESVCNHSVQHTTHDAHSVTIASKTIEWCSYGERGE